MEDPYNLQRFITAQEKVWNNVVTELQQGKKQTHWMWFVFPQLSGLGYSQQAQFYGISSLQEARSYLENELLATHLQQATALILALPGQSANDIFGSIDGLKLHSSMTLFDIVSPADIYARALDHFFAGTADKQTLIRLGL